MEKERIFNGKKHINVRIFGIDAIVLAMDKRLRYKDNENSEKKVLFLLFRCFLLPFNDNNISPLPGEGHLCRNFACVFVLSY